MPIIGLSVEAFFSSFNALLMIALINLLPKTNCDLTEKITDFYYSYKVNDTTTTEHIDRENRRKYGVDATLII